MPNTPFRKYQTSGFAFEAYSFAVYNLEWSAHNTTCEPCRPLATYVARCRGVRRIHLRSNVSARERAPSSQFGSSVHGSL